jgi:RimJ/RimL family protein N-acetyltransferase
MVRGCSWGEQVGIRQVTPMDAPALNRFLNDADVAHLLFEDNFGPLPAPWVAWVSLAIGWLGRRPDYAIVDRSGRVIGSVRLWRISEGNKSAMLTIYIGDKACWGRGYGTDALRLALREAFGPMGLKRVELHVFAFNTRAIRSYEKAGFTREGVRRMALIRGDQQHDILVMGILREEFRSLEAAAAVAAEGRLSDL